MFRTFFGFELRFWLRGMMVYVFFAIVGVLIFAAVSSDNVQIGTGGSMENINRNAPYVIQTFYAIMALLTALMTTAFVNAAAARDFTYETDQLIYTKPIEKGGFLMGRFWGSTLVSIIPMLAVSLALILAAYMPWIEREQWGPISWPAHLWGIATFAIPNGIFVAVIVFSIAVWTRSTIASFVGVLLLIVGYEFSGVLLENLDNEKLAMLCDPLGIQTFSTITKYWTVADRNTQVVTLSGFMLLNRLIWLGVGGLLLWITYRRFTFTQRARRSRAPAATEAPDITAVEVPAVSFQYGPQAQLAQLWSQVKVDFGSIVKSNVFIVVMLAAAINMTAGLWLSTSEGFGLSALPVTYNVIDVIRGTMYLFLLVTIVFYAGTLIWKERAAHFDEVYDAAPQPTWIAFTGKLIALVFVVVCIQCVGIAAGVISQLAQGYTRLQLGVYVQEMLVYDLIRFFCLIVLAGLVHVLSPNKYLGYFVFIGVVLANIFGWGIIDVETRMARYGSLPNYTYSDLFRFAPFVGGLTWFSVYWLLFTAMLCVAATLFWQRGKETSWGNRWNTATRRWSGTLRWVSVTVALAWVISGVWVYYNIKQLNKFQTSKQVSALRADYEKEFKSQHKGVAQPRVTSVQYEIDIYPERRALRLHGLQTIENKSDQPIDTMYIATSDGYETQLQIDNATLEKTYEEHEYYVYKLDPPLQVGETAQMEYTVKYEPQGFEDSVSNTSIVQNGTFFNNMIVPRIGYQSSYELTDKGDRKKHDLGKPRPMPPLAPDDLAARGNTYLDESSDWVDVETIISTAGDQIAVAPGSLQKSWEEAGRRYFHYQLDHPSLNFYSFISARYQVAVRKWNDVDIEVYYHPEHEWNVDNMLRSIRRSLEYYTENFGPYKHKQARIIEFPRVASFAQAFPGTMPYSEGIGFIADIKEADDIDMVFYIVAHEMAHQWWAHQVIGANMQGATLLSETLAQYSALMVMEKEFGRDMMRKFLQYEMDRYLRSRGREMLDEQPLRTVESGQGYIHYRKGSCVMYYLKEMIGEEKINTALRSLLEKFAYQGPPYPTSVDLIDALREQTPAELQYLLRDLFDEITLFTNRTKKATYTEREDGRFDVTIEVECKKYQADEQGKETEVPLDDWMDIGAFAKPEKDRKYGATLHRERVKITQPENTFTFTVDQLPEQAGVDPFALLIDRIPDDNMKKVRQAG